MEIYEKSRIFAVDLREAMAQIQDKDKLYAFLRPFVDWMFRRSYRHIRYVGRENVPTDGAVIFAPNHTNALCDAMAILGIDRSRKVFVARADIFRKPKQAKLPLEKSSIKSAYFSKHWKPIIVASKKSKSSVAV